jgi:putative membrane protein
MTLVLAGSSQAADPAAKVEVSKSEPRTTTKPAPMGEKVALPGTDQSFLQKAAEMNHYEIALGKIAERASSNPEIRKIAQDIVRNHTAANQQLEKLAASKGVTLPSAASQAQQQKIASLESKTGEQFDKAFLQDQLQSAQQSISTFERERSRTADPEIKSWADSMIPRLKNHLATLKTSRPEAVGEKTQKPQKGKSAAPQKKSGSSTGGD